MAIGGGTFTSQNKILPGAYINFTGLRRASAELAERGIVALPLSLDWGPEQTVREITVEDFNQNCLQLFGYENSADEMLYLRELFLHAKKAYIYRLGDSAVKAQCTYATAKYAGTRGNDIKIKIEANADDNTKFDVSTYVDNILRDKQIKVANAAGLVSNDWVDFKDATLAATAGVSLTGGTDTTITGTHHTAFCTAIESYTFNILCCGAADSATVAIYAAFIQRMRDTIGSKCQLVAWQAASDYEGVIGVWNTTTHKSIQSIDTAALCYWVAGAEASTPINRSLANVQYDGELTVDTNYTQAELEDAITAGKLMLHNVNGNVRVLEDVNSLTTLTEVKTDVFQNNQTIRVCDYVANEVAEIFANRYYGQTPNDESGRASLWNDIVKMLSQLEDLRAIEAIESENVTIAKGNTPRSVVLNINGLTVINAMSQLYMTVVVE